MIEQGIGEQEFGDAVNTFAITSCSTQAERNGVARVQRPGAMPAERTACHQTRTVESINMGRGTRHKQVTQRKMNQGLNQRSIKPPLWVSIPWRKWK